MSYVDVVALITTSHSYGNGRSWEREREEGEEERKEDGEWETAWHDMVAYPCIYRARWQIRYRGAALAGLQLADESCLYKQGRLQ